MKMKLNLWIILLIVLVISLFAFGTFSLVSTQDFAKPAWAKLICKENEFDNREDIFVPKEGNVINCGIDEMTDSCTIFLEASNPKWWSGGVKVSYKICNCNDITCSSKTCPDRWNTKSFEEGTVNELVNIINEGQAMDVECEKTLLQLNTECDMYRTYRRYRLIDDFGGASVINEKNCELPVSVKDNILSGTYKTSFTKGEWVNYVHDWYYGPAKVYQNQCGVTQMFYCTGNQLYTINTITTADGSKVKLSPDYQATAPKGDVISGKGAFIKQVQCCPHEVGCGSECNYNPGEDECEGDIDCTNGGSATKWTSTSYKTHNCVSGKCVWSEEKKVGCMDDSACNPPQVCDMAVGSTQFTCINAEPEGWCGDTRCKADESQESCPQDCGTKPKDWGVYAIIGAAIISAAIIGSQYVKKGGKRK